MKWLKKSDSWRTLKFPSPGEGSHVQWFCSYLCHDADVAGRHSCLHGAGGGEWGGGSGPGGGCGESVGTWAGDRGGGGGVFLGDPGGGLGCEGRDQGDFRFLGRGGPYGRILEGEQRLEPATGG